MASIGELVRDPRGEKDMSREELAERLGVTEDRVSAIAEDEEEPSPELLGDTRTSSDLLRGMSSMKPASSRAPDPLGARQARDGDESSTRSALAWMASRRRRPARAPARRSGP